MRITAPVFENLSNISHGFFTRRGGVSEGIYASLNCGPGSGDKRENVIENRTRAAKALGTAQLCSLYQVHSPDVVVVTTPWRHSKLPKADAMVTKMRGIALGILTADCVPVLFADPEAGIVAAAHAGWKGTIAGVLEQTIKTMIELGAKLDNIVAAVGPAIAQASYEVGAEFKETFIQKDKNYETYFITSKRLEYFLFDLKTLVRDLIANQGIKDINLLENDTYIEEDAFFSYRRTTHRAEPDYGRQISAIMLK